jgi:hypothetical protein
MRRVRALALFAGGVLVGVALYEWQYAGDHPHDYGPARLIALASLAGAAIALAVWLLASEVEQLGTRLRQSSTGRGLPTDPTAYRSGSSRSDPSRGKQNEEETRSKAAEHGGQPPTSNADDD